MTDLPAMLNLGAGRTKFPGPRPDHHALIPETLYFWPEWLNISRNASEEPDCVMDLFAYPWDLPDNTFEGALASHIVEHIPHEIKHVPLLVDIGREQYAKFERMQDGWFAWWSELYRVLKPGAMVHVLAPYATSHGFLGDPTHTRPIVEQVFYHSMKPDPNAPFEYSTGGLHFEVREMRYSLMPGYSHLAPSPDEPEDVQRAKQVHLDHVIHTQWNVINDLYVRLECIK